MSVLTSAQNPLVKDVRRAVAQGRLTERGYAVAEGFHLLEEALRSDCEIHAILTTEAVREAVEGHVRRLPRLKVTVVGDTAFSLIASTETSQGVITLVKPPAWNWDHLFRGRSLVVVVDGVQDPGNAGAIARVAEAFGATGCLFLKGAASPYHPKTLRAAAGSLFRLPFLEGIAPEIASAAVRQRRLDIYAAMPHGDTAITEADLSRRVAIVVGSEGRGVSEPMRAGARGLRIPTAGVESLNVATSAAIILYEARRQRTLQ